MSEDEIIERIIQHDEILKSLTRAVEHLADASTGHNKKLDKVLELQVGIKVIMEKFISLERELKDSFRTRDESIRRAHKRMDKFEEIHSISGKGCPALISVKQDTDTCTKVRNWLFKIVGTVVILALLSSVIIGVSRE